MKKQEGFKLEKDAHGPTMKQKVHYVLKLREQGQTQMTVAETAANIVDAMTGKLVRSIYNRSSVSTHTATTKREVEQIHGWVRTELCELIAYLAISRRFQSCFYL